MTRKRCKELLPIMQAFAEGKEIQFKDKTSEEWVNLVNDDSTFCINDWCEYRIKPTEEYRPYKDCDEMIKDFASRFHQLSLYSCDMPLIWVKDEKATSLITDFGVNGDNERICLGAKNYDMQELFDDFTYLDGSIIGVRV